MSLYFRDPDGSLHEFITDAAAEAGTHRMMGTRWLRAEGGVRPRRGRDLKVGACRFLSGRRSRSRGLVVSRCGRSLGGWDATRRGSVASWRATPAGLVGIARRRRTLAYERACRPKPAKLATNVVLRKEVEQDLRRRSSPEQIVGRLRHEFPRSGDVGVGRDDLSVAVCPVAWGSAP
jgi:IS30 family transposase